MPDTLTTDAHITDRRFAALKAKLRELFELDKSDLDFGIYRIMAAKNEEVTAFLDRQLRDVVRQTVTAHGADAVDDVRAELDECIKRLRGDGLSEEQIDTYPKVVELRARLDGAGGASVAELEADIYNHLLNFFSHYYDEGDFISKRRYKGDTYAIPYSGEEVVLHWANKDQYYIKSGEWHKDYRFRAGGKAIRFRLVDATEVTGNNKEPDEAKRRYILVDDQPVVVDGGTLTLRFHFRAPTDGDKQRAAGAVAIFGADYAKPRGAKKGDERTQFCADAERRALEHVPADWQPVVTAASATDDKPARSILGKHLDHFTARNAFDYFIHKDLGGFLSRELDFYIKNEVARLNNLPAHGDDLLAGRSDAEKDALIRYALDLEMGPHLLDLDAFRDPWGYSIDAQLAGDDEIRPQRVDLIETFNYLLGLRVTAYGPLERYSADFERAQHDADLGRLKINGKLRRDAEGPFVFQQIEGTLNDDNDTPVLVVWRTLTDDPEQDAAVLDARLERYGEKTTERSDHREYAKIYLNGPITLPQPTAELRTVYPIEETFKARMFEDGE